MKNKLFLVAIILGLMILPMVIAQPSKYENALKPSNAPVVIAVSDEEPLGTCNRFLDERGFTKVYCKKIWFNTKEVALK